MSFSDALNKLKQNCIVARSGWNGKNMWIRICYPSPSSDMDLPYIYMFTAQEQVVPWLASQTDILAEDWTLF